MTAAPRRLILTETVYDVIRQRLLDQEIAPGSKVNISGLSTELDVSPTPIREALARLESDGLVVKRSLAGYTAAPLMSSADFANLFEMRLLLEPAAAHHAAVHITEADLLAVEEHLDAMRRAPSETSRETLRLFVREDALFHARIAVASGNALMADTLQRFHSHTHLYRLYFHAGVTAATCREHERIVEALRTADSDMAEAAMRSHIRKAHQRLLPAVHGTDTVDRA